MSYYASPRVNKLLEQLEIADEALQVAFMLIDAIHDKAVERSKNGYAGETLSNLHYDILYGRDYISKALEEFTEVNWLMKEEE